MCDNVEYKNESINKTLRLFDVPPDRTKILLLSHTPKRSTASSCKRNSEKEQINNDQMQLDVTNEHIFCVDVKDTEKIEATNNEVVTNKREESNAFQVLMTHIKPEKYLTPKHFVPEEDTISTKNRQELKLEFKQNKDKLIILADRKGYRKRKLAEKEGEEEPETIKNKLRTRSKILKKTDSKDYIVASPSASNQKIFVHGLHNYFNIITPEEREKARLLAESTMVVEADVQDAKSTGSAKSLAPKIDNNKVESKTRQILAAIDDIQFLRSETSNPPLREAITSQQTQEQQSQSERKKSKWSLRINFHSHGQDYNIIDGAVLDEENRRLSNCTRDKRRGIITEVDKNRKCQKQKELKDSIHGDKVSGNNIEFNTENSSLVTDNEIKDIPKKNAGVFHGRLTRNDSEEIIEITELKRPLNEKLAPLFMKRLKPDPQVLAARRLFLHSRSPDNTKKTSQHTFHVPTISIFPFPSVSHVTQLDIYSGSNISCHNSKYRVKAHPNYVTSIDPTHMKYINSFSNSITKYSMGVNEVLKVNIEAVLQKIERKCTDAREIWGKISSVADTLNHRLFSTKRRSMDKKTNQINNRTNVQIDTWTQKYKPLCAKEVVGNEEAAMKLRNWLRTWKLSACKDDYSSSDEFCCSENTYNNSSENNQVAVLLGPHGSGKTASVYAISEELGYTVLEVNASSKRSGRKILKELEEATKSHRVKKTDSQSMLSTNKNIPERSLVLIEDVDLIFDEDEGFVSAIYQLSSNTKRPIVMTCRHLCPHLNRMAPQQLRISFESISGTRAIALLELIALAESGFSISRLCLEKLIAKGDLRRALVELQYLLLSGAVRTPDLSRSFHKTLWQDMSSYLYTSSVEESKERTKNKYEYVQKTSAPLRSIDESFHSLVDDLDIVSLVSSLVDIDDQTLNISKVKFEPNVSLEESADTYSNNNVRNAEISEWLRYQVTQTYIEEYDEINMKALNQLMAKKKLNMSVYSALSQVSSYTLDTQILSTDYLPIVRTICRAENEKESNNMKRGNRFFHYLQNLRIPSASIRPNILITACRILQERAEKLPKP